MNFIGLEVNGVRIFAVFYVGGGSDFIFRVDFLLAINSSGALTYAAVPTMIGKNVTHEDYVHSGTNVLWVSAEKLTGVQWFRKYSGGGG